MQRTNPYRQSEPSWADSHSSRAMRLGLQSTNTSATAITAQRVAAALPLGLTCHSQLNEVLPIVVRIAMCICQLSVTAQSDITLVICNAMYTCQL